MAWLPAIDVSRYQGDINWAGISEPIVMIKMSGGDDGLYMDGKAAQNYSGALAAGKAVGGYHFAGATNPFDEANYFVRAMAPVAENDVYALDWEVQHDDPVGWCLSFVNTVHDKTGVWPLIYMNASSVQSHDWSPVLTNCGLWIAHWGYTPDQDIPNVPTYVMHQYNDGPFCDHDAWYGTINQFKAYGYHAPVGPGPGPTPEPAPGTTTTTTTTTLPPIPGSTTTTTTLPPLPGPDPNISWIVKAIKALLKFFHIRSPK